MSQEYNKKEYDLKIWETLKASAQKGQYPALRKMAQYCPTIEFHSKYLFYTSFNEINQIPKEYILQQLEFNGIDTTFYKYEDILRESIKIFSGSANNWYNYALHIADIMFNKTITYPEIIHYIPTIVSIYGNCTIGEHLLTAGYTVKNPIQILHMVQDLEKMGFYDLLSESKQIVFGNILIPLMLYFNIDIPKEMFDESQIIKIKNDFDKNKNLYFQDITDSLDFLTAYQSHIPEKWRKIITLIFKRKDILDKLKEKEKQDYKRNIINGYLTDKDIVYRKGLLQNQIKNIQVITKNSLETFTIYEKDYNIFKQEITRALEQFIITYIDKFNCFINNKELEELSSAINKAANSEYAYIIDKYKKQLIYASIKELDLIFKKDELDMNSYDDEKINALQQIIKSCSTFYKLQKSKDKIQELVSRRTYKKLKYKTERLCYRLLLERGIYPMLQYKFDDCRDTYPLPFDFAFYINTQLCCIETDGTQHDKALDIYGGEEGFEVRQKHDKIKTDYCKKHHISLLRLKEKDISDWENQIDKFLIKICA